MSKIVQSRRFLVNLLGPLLETGLPSMKNVIKALTAAASPADTAIQNKNFWSSMITLIIPNEEMDGIMKIAKSLKESGLLIKDVHETIKYEAKEKKS